MGRLSNEGGLVDPVAGWLAAKAAKILVETAALLGRKRSLIGVSSREAIGANAMANGHGLVELGNQFPMGLRRGWFDNLGDGPSKLAEVLRVHAQADHEVRRGNLDQCLGEHLDRRGTVFLLIVGEKNVCRLAETSNLLHGRAQMSQ